MHDRNRLPDTDFADFMINFGEWWEKYGNTALTVVLLIVLGGVAWWFFTSRAYQAHENAWAELAFNTSPQGFREVAQTHDDPAVKALANLRGGDLLLGEAVTPESTAAQATPENTAAGEGRAVTPAQPPRDPQTALKDAEHDYRQVLAVAKDPIYQINALMGLGAVAESRKQWDAAKQHYEQAIKLAGDTYAFIADQARRRIALISELKTPIVFAPAAKPKASTPASSESSKSSAKPDLSESASERPDQTGKATATSASASSKTPAQDRPEKKTEQAPTAQTTASSATAP